MTDDEVPKTKISMTRFHLREFLGESYGREIEMMLQDLWSKLTRQQNDTKRNLTLEN